MNLQRIKDFIYRNMGYIALYNVAFMFIFYVLKYSGLSFNTLRMVDYLRFDFLDLSYFKIRLFKLRYMFNSGFFSELSEIFNPVFYSILLIGAILYIRSKRQEKRLLEFGIAVTFIANMIVLLIGFFSVIYIIYAVGTNNIPYPKMGLSQVILLLVFQFIKVLIIIMVCYFFLKETKKRREFEILPEGTSDIVFLQDRKCEMTHKRVGKGPRFVHLIVDSALIILIFSPLLMSLIFRPITRIIENNLGERLGLLTVFFLFAVLYYVIFEGLFRTTPGKYLTSSAVTGFDTLKVKGSQIVGRSFSRKIPFNAFSFFGEIGWHDLFSQTTISSYKSDDRYKGTVVGVMVTAAIIILIVMLANLMR